ncbi:hypothetical protein Sjap_008477 [Stephania japonica]|uniref:Endonuclease/exonuclease/phosphatase domain-containing protein n=1 Tax=Stephania japonica TaxID=461633 RepID=A0AAP0JR61_9MAGN
MSTHQVSCPIFVWNCLGASKSGFLNIIKGFIKQHKLNILALMEPHVSGIKADRLIPILGFSCSHRIEGEGFSGGIWVCWKEEILVTIICNNIYIVHPHDRQNRPSTTVLLYGSVW